MTDPPCIHEEGCITCGDEAVPMRVVRVDERRGLALCEDDDGRRQSVEIELVAPVAPGDGLLVHAGTALSRTAGGRPPHQDAGLDAGTAREARGGRRPA